MNNGIAVNRGMVADLVRFGAGELNTVVIPFTMFDRHIVHEHGAVDCARKSGPLGANHPPAPENTPAEELLYLAYG